MNGPQNHRVARTGVPLSIAAALVLVSAGLFVLPVAPLAPPIPSARLPGPASSAAGASGHGAATPSQVDPLDELLAPTGWAEPSHPPLPAMPADLEGAARPSSASTVTHPGSALTLTATPDTGPAPLSVVLEATLPAGASGTVSCTWLFGDVSTGSPGCPIGSGSSLNETHVYGTPGAYVAQVYFSLTVTNGSVILVQANTTITVTPNTLLDEWSELATGTSPGPRAGAAMAYDPALGEVILFGGAAPRGAGVAYLGDTWTYRAGVWTNITSTLSVSPPPRYQALIAYDSADGYLLMVGGYSYPSPTLPYSGPGAASLNDTWTFGSGGWTQGPTFPRVLEWENELTDDVADGYVALTGETNTCYCVWGYAAGTWREVSGSDPALWYDPTAYDSTISQVISLQGNSTYWTFAYSGGTWTRLDTNSPDWDGWLPIVDDPQVGGLVMPMASVWDMQLSGGATPCGDQATCFQTWTYSGGVWTNVTSFSAHLPSMRNGAAMTYDAADGYLLMYGGVNASGFLGDTWSFYAGSDAGTLQVQATATPTNGPAPFTTDLSALGTGGTPPYTYAWSFGDGSPPASGATVTHEFADAGDFAVTVEVTDALGNQSSYVLSISVAISHPLTAVAAVEPLSGPAPLEVLMEGSAAGGWGSTYSYGWSFGDGSGGSGKVTSHWYNISGYYTGSLSVGDAVGETAGESFHIIVTSPVVGAPLSVSAAGAPSVGASPLAVDFASAISGGEAPYALSWNFGDGSPTSASASPEHTYNASGTYEAVLSVTDSAGDTNQSFVAISVSSGGAGALEATASESTRSGAPPLAVVFSVQASGGDPPYQYVWDLGDGDISTEENLSHAYTEFGTYFPAVLVTDSRGDTFHVALPAVYVNATLPSQGASSSGRVWGEGALVIGAAVIVLALASLVYVRLFRRRPPVPRAGGPPSTTGATETPPAASPKDPG